MNEEQRDRWPELGSWLAVCDREFDALTLLKFTTGWKAAVGTLESVGDEDRGYVWSLRTAESAEEACRDLVLREKLATQHEAIQVERSWEGRDG